MTPETDPVPLAAGWTCGSTASYLGSGILTGRWAHVSGTELRLLEEVNWGHLNGLDQIAVGGWISGAGLAERSL